MATGQISNLGGMAKNFIAGEDGLSAVPKLKAMRKDGYAPVDLLGEATVMSTKLNSTSSTTYNSSTNSPLRAIVGTRPAD